MTKRTIDPDWAKQQLASAKAVTSVHAIHDTQYNSYLRAAAALDVFDETLVPLDSNASDTGFKTLQTSSRVTQLPNDKLAWRFDHRQRTNILREMTFEDLKKVYSLNPKRLMTKTQVMIERFVNSKPPEINKCSLEDLAAIGRVVIWFDGVLDNLPTTSLLQEKTEYLRLLDPFFELTKDGFHGRDSEYEEVRNYIGVMPAESGLTQFTSMVKDVFSFYDKPLLVINGSGGIGKSTLLAKLILEHSFEALYEPVPFIYLNFESHDLIDEPLTLIVQSVTQLGIQLPDSVKEANELAERARDVMSRTSFGKELESKVGRLRQRERETCVALFLQFLEKWTPKTIPLLFVMDTFEKVQISNVSWVPELWQFLSELQQTLPRLRVIVAGRRQIEDWPSRNLYLVEMNKESAIAFLAYLLRKNKDIGKHECEQIYEAIGGNPLSLKLAASALDRVGLDDALKGVKRKRWFLLPIRDAQVQGQLYRRILDHIEDESIRKLAHPGLVLRRITPSIVMDVLADACDINVSSLKNAQDLCDRFERYADLVTRAPDGSLRHREDVRTVMLPTLKADQPERVAKIHHLAIKYYEKHSNESTNPVFRIEELYHRMAIGDDHSILETRWIPEARESLAAFEDEFTASANVFLRSVLKLSIDDDLLKRANTEIWEREVVRRAEGLIVKRELINALKQIQARQERSGSPGIIRLEATILEQLNRPKELDRVYQAGLDAAMENDHLGDYIEIALANIRSLESHNRLEDALEAIKNFRSIATESLSDDKQLETELAELRIYRKLDRFDSELQKTAIRATHRYLSLDAKSLGRNVNLSLQAAAELGDDSNVLARVLKISPPLLHNQDQHSLSEYMSVFLADAAKKRSKESKRQTDLMVQRIGELIDPSRDSYRRELAKNILDSNIDSNVVDALVDLYRHSL